MFFHPQMVIIMIYVFMLFLNVITSNTHDIWKILNPMSSWKFLNVLFNSGYTSSGLCTNLLKWSLKVTISTFKDYKWND
jgi:hypothetical protein